MPGKKKDESNHANSNAEFLKDLDLQNEVIYNKNTVKEDFILVVRFIVASCLNLLN